MLLKSIRLNNIRSYVDEIIHFPEGKVLLAGDIGAGKSTILLAIEFALLGMKRGITTGSYLLRHGTDFGVVELHFELNQQQIIINRPLKRTKQGIKQEAGYLVINNQKIDATPLELRARMLQLLGYPEDILNKGNDYLYRYTIYTPQEEMKSILLDTKEGRLATIRKIFNIDKYQLIRENAQYIIRELKTKNKILEERSISFEDIKKKAQLLEQEIISLQAREKILEEKKVEIENIKETNKQELSNLEKKLKEKQEITSLLQITEEKKKQVEQEKAKLEKLKTSYLVQKELLQEKMSKIIIESLEDQEEQLTQMIEDLQKEIITVAQKSAALQQQQTLLKQAQLQREQEIAQTEKKLEEKQDLEQDYKNRAAAVHKKEVVAAEKELLTTQHILIIKKRTETEQLLEQSKYVLKQITTLAHCPLCLQDVHDEHKAKITKEEEKKQLHCCSLLAKAEEEKEQLLTKIREQEQTLQEIQEHEKKLSLIQLALHHLMQVEEELQKKKQQHQEAKQALINLQQEQLQLASFDKEQKENEKQQLVQRLQKLRKTQQLQREKIFLEQTIQEKEQLCQALEKEKYELQQKEQQVREDLSILQAQSKVYDNAEQYYTQSKQSYDRILEHEKVVSNTKAALFAERITKEQYQQQLQKDMEICKTAQQEQQKNMQLITWLSAMFIELMSVLEKTILQRIYHDFTAAFGQWFNLLIDDEDIIITLDDTFSPLIEQNGYETEIDNLSGGERTALALAYRLSLNKVINDITATLQTKGLLILDEPTDGFSSEQLDKMREVLDQLNIRQILLVSHEPKMEAYVDCVLRISKETQVSVLQHS